MKGANNPGNPGQMKWLKTAVKAYNLREGGMGTYEISNRLGLSYSITSYYLTRIRQAKAIVDELGKATK